MPIAFCWFLILYANLQHFLLDVVLHETIPDLFIVGFFFLIEDGHFDLNFDGWLYLFVDVLLKIDITEPLMCQYLLNATLKAQSLCWLLVQQFNHKILYSTCKFEIFWKFDFGIENMVFGLFWCEFGMVEWWWSYENLKEKISYCIVINLKWMSLILYDFRCHIIETTTEWEGFVIDLFCKAKIN